MKHSFRRRLFAAMLLASLLPLLLCTVLMVQITRLRMQNKAPGGFGGAVRHFVPEPEQSAGCHGAKRGQAER